MVEQRQLPGPVAFPAAPRLPAPSGDPRSTANGKSRGLPERDRHHPRRRRRRQRRRTPSQITFTLEASHRRRPDRGRPRPAGQPAARGRPRYLRLRLGRPAAWPMPWRSPRRATRSSSRRRKAPRSRSTTAAASPQPPPKSPGSPPPRSTVSRRSSGTPTLTKRPAASPSCRPSGASAASPPRPRFSWSRTAASSSTCRSPASRDLLTRRVAHEVAHQWWGHGLTPEGGPGRGGAGRVAGQIFRARDGRNAARPRKPSAASSNTSWNGTSPTGRPATGEEVPLAEVEGDDYLFYRKGALATHAIEAAIGQDAFRDALASLLEEAESGRTRAPPTWWPRSRAAPRARGQGTGRRADAPDRALGFPADRGQRQRRQAGAGDPGRKMAGRRERLRNRAGLPNGGSGRAGI